MKVKDNQMPAVIAQATAMRDALTRYIEAYQQTSHLADNGLLACDRSEIQRLAYEAGFYYSQDKHKNAAEVIGIPDGL